MDAGGVQAVRRLVEDAQLRVGQQCRGDAEPLLHAERVGAHEVVGTVAQLDHREYLGDARVIDAAKAREYLKVASTRKGRIERGSLDQRADATEV
jgi:hypothetical protein